MTVRGFIWVWQLVEAAVLFVFLLFNVNLFTAMTLLLPVMVFLRLMFVGLVALIVMLNSQGNRLPFQRFVQYWLRESFAFCRLYFFDQARPRSTLIGSSEVRNKHLIFAHGFLCNDGFWQLLAKAALQDGFSVSFVEQDTAFGDIEDFTDKIEQEINRIKKIKPLAGVTCISFSMGGLACRALPPEVKSNLNLITVFTPHFGTWLSWFALPFGAINAKQMRPDNAWLNSLNQKPDLFKHCAGFWTKHDTIVIPADLSKPTFPALMLKGRGHLTAAYDQRLHSHVMRVLRYFYKQ